MLKGLFFSLRLLLTDFELLHFLRLELQVGDANTVEQQTSLCGQFVLLRLCLSIVVFSQLDLFVCRNLSGFGLDLLAPVAVNGEFSFFKKE